jgi:hypothetical protein
MASSGPFQNLTDRIRPGRQNIKKSPKPPSIDLEEAENKAANEALRKWLQRDIFKMVIHGMAVADWREYIEQVMVYVAYKADGTKSPNSITEFLMMVRISLEIRAYSLSAKASCTCESIMYSRKHQHYADSFNRRPGFLPPTTSQICAQTSGISTNLLAMRLLNIWLSRPHSATWFTKCS